MGKMIGNRPMTVAERVRRHREKKTGKVGNGKRGRPPIGDKPMTTAERMRELRKRKKENPLCNKK